MNIRTLVTAAAFAALTTASMTAQSFQRRATFTGGGGADWGRCTVDVIVDGAADVEIRGDTALLRNISGQPPQWRGFECTSAMPPNPARIRFNAQGRGRQEMLRDPSNGGVALVRIEDQEPGPGEYRFEITWTSGYGNPSGQYRNRWNDNGYNQNVRISPDQAVRVCENTIQQQASERFYNSNIVFRRTALDDTPGRQDRVNGTFEVRRGFGRSEMHRFSCSVDFDNGQVRSAQIDPGYGGGGGGVSSSNAIQACEQAARERMRESGYDSIQFGSIQVQDNPGGDDRVFGTASASGQYGRESLNFSCSMRLESGVVRSVDVTRR